MHIYNCFSVRWNKVPSPDRLGNFELLLDEELAALETTQDPAPTNRQRSSRWK